MQQPTNQTWGPTLVGEPLNQTLRGQGAMHAIATAVNPFAGTINCGFIIDCVINRLTGVDPYSVAHVPGDGSFNQIESRHHTRFNWDTQFNRGTTFSVIFQEMRSRGHGSIGLVGIIYSSKLVSHIVTIANLDDEVAIMEGQGWGGPSPPGAVTSAADADLRYNRDGGSLMGLAIVR